MGISQKLKTVDLSRFALVCFLQKGMLCLEDLLATVLRQAFTCLMRSHADHLLWAYQIPSDTIIQAFLGMGMEISKSILR